jgi:hypothetical protein
MFVLFIFNFGAVPSFGSGRYGNVPYQAKQCCGSGMFIPDHDFFYPGSFISDPGSYNNKKEEGEIFFGLLFWSQKFCKLKAKLL